MVGGLGPEGVASRLGVMMTVVDPSSEVSARPAGGAPEGSGFGAWLALWMALAVGLNGIEWVAGFRKGGLVEAVERGAARVESRGIGEVSDDLIRKAIETQHDTLPFWTTLALLGDFLADPLALSARAWASATAFAALAALAGRSVRYERALAECSAAQGAWVLAMAVRLGLMVALRRADVETSPALLLPPGIYPAAACLALRQLDVFAVLGWALLARGACRRGQVGPASAVAVCLAMGMVEAAFRIGVGLVIGSGMRLEVTAG